MTLNSDLLEEYEKLRRKEFWFDLEEGGGEQLRVNNTPI